MNPDQVDIDRLYRAQRELEQALETTPMTPERRVQTLEILAKVHGAIAALKQRPLTPAEELQIQVAELERAIRRDHYTDEQRAALQLPRGASPGELCNQDL